MASLHPQNSPQGTFDNKSCCPVVILLLSGEDFLIREDIFVPILGVQLEDSLCSLRAEVSCHV